MQRAAWSNSPPHNTAELRQPMIDPRRPSSMTRRVRPLAALSMFRRIRRGRIDVECAAGDDAAAAAESAVIPSPVAENLGG